MNRLKLILSFLLFCSLAKAQTKISGILKSAAGKPLANANIGLKSSYDGTSTDSNGKFEFITAEKGLRILRFSAITFETDSVEVKLEGKPVFLELVIRESMNHSFP